MRFVLGAFGRYAGVPTASNIDSIQMHDEGRGLGLEDDVIVVVITGGNITFLFIVMH